MTINKGSILNNKDLSGKKILLFIPKFFTYGEAIRSCCAELGANVTLYDERAVVSALSRAIIKTFPFFFKHKANKYYEKIINAHKNEKIDYILIVRCDMVSPKILKIFRRTFPNSKLCLHLWDSLSNIKGINKKLKYFDVITSFDRKDCEENENLIFRPLFYMNKNRVESVRMDLADKDIDIYFCGTIHSDRFKIIKSIKNQCSQLGLKYDGYHYLQSKFVYTYFKILKKEFKRTNKRDFKFDVLPAEDLSEKVSRSKSILDIQHPKQAGLTMRTIETLGMEKKIITTNEDIKNYDFYNSENIMIIDRSNPTISADFIVTPFNKIPNNIWEKYSLEQWVYDVLGEEIGVNKDA